MRFGWMAAVAAMVLAAPAGAVTTLTTESFEEPEVGANAVTGLTFSRLTFNEFAGIAGNGSPLGYSDTPFGDQFAFFKPGGVMTFTVSGLEIGRAYNLTLSLVRPAGKTALAILTGFSGGGGAASTTGRTEFANAIGNAGSYAARFETETFTFFAQRRGINPTDVAIDRITISTVPEPTTWAMLIGGIGAVGGAIRRKGKRQLAHA